MAQLHPDPSGGQLVQNYTIATGTFATSGDNTAIVAAPGASLRNVIKELVIQNESTVTTTVLIKAGSTTKWRAVLAQEDALVLSFAVGEEWRMGANEALVPNLSGANSHGYTVRYFTETAN